MNKDKKAILTQLLALWVIVNALTYIFRKYLTEKGFDLNFLWVANTFIFVVSVVAVFIQYRGATSANNQAFFRSVYSAMMIRMFLSAIAVVIYAVAVNGGVNKPALLTSMGLYLLYTGIEVTGLMKTLRKKNG